MGMPVNSAPASTIQSDPRTVPGRREIQATNLRRLLIAGPYVWRAARATDNNVGPDGGGVSELG